MASTSAANVNTSVAAQDPGAVSDGVERNVYRCYFRELDMEVFTTLSRGFALKKKKDIQVCEAVCNTMHHFNGERFLR